MVRHVVSGSRFDPEVLSQVQRPLDAVPLSSTAFRTLWIPIEHAKTTWLSIVLPLWFLAVDQEAMGALIGNRQEDAQKPLGVIRWHIENNQLLRADFPELRPDFSAGWSDARIFVERRSRSKDPSIQTSGITGTIQGARLEFVLGDDVQDRQRALSPVKNQADQENWQEIIENRVVDGGICSSYGTLQTAADLTGTLSRAPGYKHLHLSAYDTEGRYGERGATIWMTEERLQAARARQGERRFARKYLNDAKDEGGKQLKASWIKFVDRADIPWKDLVYFAGVDPATGEAETADPDEYAICWGGKAPDGRVYVLGFRGANDWGIVEGTEHLDKLNTAHGFRRVAVESVGFGVAAKQHIWQHTGVRAYKSPTVKDKPTRFENMAVNFENGRVLVYERGEGVFGDDESENFYDQWIDFPEGRHDDRLDAWCLETKELRNGNSQCSEGFSCRYCHNVWCCCGWWG
jgi:predicted phage terminase large subunit-like protein